MFSGGGTASARRDERSTSAKIQRVVDSRERVGRVGRGGAKLQLLMVGSRRLGGVTNLESDKHAGKPGAFAIFSENTHFLTENMPHALSRGHVAIADPS